MRSASASRFELTQPHGHVKSEGSNLKITNKTGIEASTIAEETGAAMTQPIMKRVNFLSPPKSRSSKGNWPITCQARPIQPVSPPT